MIGGPQSTYCLECKVMGTGLNPFMRGSQTVPLGEPRGPRPKVKVSKDVQGDKAQPQGGRLASDSPGFSSWLTGDWGWGGVIKTAQRHLEGPTAEKAYELPGRSTPTCHCENG